MRICLNHVRSLVALALLMVLLSGCERRSHQVRYVVTGQSALVGISYRNASGGTEQREVGSGWATSFRVQSWEYVGITVFNKSAEGNVGCQLYVDGRLIEAADSRGGYSLAHCDGLAGVEE